MRALSRKKANRKSTLRNLATSLILFERIKTTTPKSKELKPIVEHLIHIAKPGDVNSRRKLMAYLFDENAAKKVLEVLVPRYKNLQSGFIKSYKVGIRLGDGADMTILELQKGEETKLVKQEEENDKSKKVEKSRPKDSATKSTK
jgi:large subunit ribosomal protein L17